MKKEKMVRPAGTAHGVVPHRRSRPRSAPDRTADAGPSQTCRHSRRRTRRSWRSRKTSRTGEADRRCQGQQGRCAGAEKPAGSAGGHLLRSRSPTPSSRSTRRGGARPDNQQKEGAQYDLFCRQVREEEEGGQPPIWSVLFKATSMADLLSRIEFVNEVAEHDQSVINDLQAAAASRCRPTGRRWRPRRSQLESRQASWTASWRQTTQLIVQRNGGRPETIWPLRRRSR